MMTQCVTFPISVLNYGDIHKREMLMSAIRALVKNSNKENFYGKRKKIINVLTTFFIFHKSDVKNFLKWIVNECPKGTR